MKNVRKSSEFLVFCSVLTLGVCLSTMNSQARILETQEEGLMYNFQDLVNITDELRSEHGCPWDLEQTHESLKKCLEEESGEVLEAIDHQDMENLCEELGDILLQVMLHSQIAKENGSFTIDQVVDGLCQKLIRRHPHVFGEKKAISAEEGRALWEEIKKQEKVFQKQEKP